MRNDACLSVLFPLDMKTGGQFFWPFSKGVLPACSCSCSVSHTSCSGSLIHTPSVRLWESLVAPALLIKSFVSMKYDTRWAVLFRLITLTQTQHGENLAMWSADRSRSNTFLVFSVQETACLRSFALFCALFSPPDLPGYSMWLNRRAWSLCSKWKTNSWMSRDFSWNLLLVDGSISVLWFYIHTVHVQIR